MTVPYFYKNSNSRFLSIEGEDSNEFLQNLITNDINQCSEDNILYSCLFLIVYVFFVIVLCFFSIAFFYMLDY